jgi:hypothetical protein
MVLAALLLGEPSSWIKATSSGIALAGVALMCTSSQRVHHTARRHSGGVAGGGARATGDAGDRLPQRSITPLAAQRPHRGPAAQQHAPTASLQPRGASLYGT